MVKAHLGDIDGQQSDPNGHDLKLWQMSLLNIVNESRYALS